MQKLNVRGMEAIGVICWIWVGLQWFNGRTGFIPFSSAGGNDDVVLGINIAAGLFYTGAFWFVYRMIKKYRTK